MFTGILSFGVSLFEEVNSLWNYGKLDVIVNGKMTA